MQPQAAAARPLVMADVAALAGVSHQTVSRVINGHPSVAPQTRERVERAIAELGYRPNIAARALVTGSTRTIGLVTVKINQYGPAQTMLGLEKAARAAGYSLSVSILDDATAGAMRDAVDTFVAQSVDAIVALSTYDDAAEALSRDRRRRCRWSPSRWAATRTGRRSASTRRPAPGWPPATCSTSATGRCTTSPAPPTRRRRGGASRAGAPELLAAGAPRARAAPWRLDAVVGLRGRARWLAASAGGEEITAVFLANDQMALGLLAALHEEGIEVPTT